MPNVDQWDQAAQKMIQLTENDKLNWQVNLFPVTMRNEVLRDTIYCAHVQGHWVAVYEYRYQEFYDADNWYWSNEVAIEFVTANGDLEWRWPTVPCRVQLLDAIRAKICGANDFLKRFLESA